MILELLSLVGTSKGLPSSSLLEGGATVYLDLKSLQGWRFYSIPGRHAQMPHIFIRNNPYPWFIQPEPPSPLEFMTAACASSATHLHKKPDLAFSVASSRL